MGISTHILDTSLGRPAAGVRVTLEQQAMQGWVQVSVGKTDDDGRCKTLTPEDFSAGEYRISFDTGGYYGRKQEPTFYPVVRIVFEVTDASEHYHVPLLLNPYGYSTYRGS